MVSPDVGGVVRARAIAKRLDDADLAIIDKRRPKANVSTVMNIIGDVSGKTCVLVDDIVDTAGTLCAAAAALKQHGAKKVVAYCTHPVLSGAAINNISSSALDELVVTDTIPLYRCCPRLQSHPPAERGGIAGRNDPSHRDGRVGEYACTWIDPEFEHRESASFEVPPGTVIADSRFPNFRERHATWSRVA